jgi:hypothetical protein
MAKGKERNGREGFEITKGQSEARMTSNAK